MRGLLPAFQKTRNSQDKLPKQIEKIFIRVNSGRRFFEGYATTAPERCQLPGTILWAAQRYVRQRQSGYISALDDYMKKIALITGANKGIGFETARQLGKLGVAVLVGARDEARGESAAKQLQDETFDAHFLMIDPTKAASVQDAAREVENKFGRLDVLINNAAVFLADDSGPPAEVPTKVSRETFDINVFGLHEVTRTFWPLLNRSAAARLVNVSSALGSLTLHSNGSLGTLKAIAYDASKAAVNMMTVHYAFQWQGTPHRANALHPGSVKTDMNPQGELSVEEGAKTSVSLATIDENGPNGGFFHLGERLPW